jgi:AraC-like DNA-binding protein
MHIPIGPGWSFTPRIPDYHTLTLINNAQTEYSVDNEKFIVGHGEMILMPGGLQKIGHILGNRSGDICSVHFYGEPAASFPLTRGIHFRGMPEDELKDAFKRMHMHWISRTTGDLRCCVGYLNVILGLISVPDHGDKAHRADLRVERMRQHMVNHVGERTDLRILARVAGVSRAYAGTLFHRQTGMTVQNYANALRVRKAQSLMSESSESLSEIAKQCGFDDVFYFSKVFKKHSGHSPSEYRRSGQ